MVAPELHLTGSILEESERIKSSLLVVQANVDAHASQRADSLVKALRAEQGYFAPAEEVEADDLIDTRISGKTPVIPPGLLARLLPVTPASAETTGVARRAAVDILNQRDDRLVVVVGPCSIHDPEAALDYAGGVSRWRDSYGDNLEIIMRAYMEKPRTERGWKGFVYDPRLDESEDINLGVVATRLLASRITRQGVPIAMERLNALTPQYVSGFVAYDAIGARNTTDQKAREYASGTSSPVGFKNTPEGSIEVAAQAIVSAKGPHAFLGMDMKGTLHQVNTRGNDTGHIILRGDQAGPNYSAAHVARAKKLLAQKDLLQAIIIDASHGNSNKMAAQQLEVIMDIADQVGRGEAGIKGVMIESNLVAGKQALKPGRELVYGQSITDECVGPEQTQGMLELLAQAVRRRRAAV